MSFDQIVYYQRRERVARDLAARALDPCVSRIHLEMADRYAELTSAEASASRTAAHQREKAQLLWVR